MVYKIFSSANITIVTQPWNVMWAKRLTHKEETKNSMPISNFKLKQQTAVGMRKKDLTGVGIKEIGCKHVD